MLIVLCVLTLLGNTFLILKGILVYYMLDITSDGRRASAIVAIDVFYVVEFLTCIGAMVGAVLMLSRRRVGLVVYAVSTVMYMLITGALAILSILSIAGIPLALLQFVYLVPSALFLLLFTQQRKYLV